ncbi:MAG: response regulator [Anaerolineales bacterium]|nr:response regulator [Anaerolineales bacterium]
MVEAEDGAQAISIFESLQPDLVLLDAMMPLMDGFATCAHLRTLPASEGTPILMVTALTDNEAVERAFEVGSTDYIIKPVHKAVLRHRVRHLVRAKQAEDALRRSERLYRAIVEDQTEFICRFLPNGVLTFVNEVYCRYLDRQPQELIGHNFMPFISTEDIDLVEHHLASLNLDNPVETIEYRVNKPTGEIGWHQWTHRLIFDDQGHLIELQGVGRDITERKQMETRLLNAQNRPI